MSIDLNETEPPPPQYNLEELSRGLRDRADQWVPQLFVRGRIVVGQLRLANISGDPPREHGSCVIELKGERAGDWFDHTTGKGGGPLSALEHATGLVGRDLFAKAAEIVGASIGRKRRTNGAGKASDHIPQATQIWNTTQNPAGTRTESYLTSRGLWLPPTEDLRHSDDITDFAGMISRPAMIAQVRNPETGEPTGGIHRTYLTEGGRAAKVEMHGKHKLALGPTRGGVVMLKAMREDGWLGIAEGIETALAVMEIDRLGDPSPTPDPLPVWATLGTVGFGPVDRGGIVFPPGLKKLWVFCDAGKVGIERGNQLRDRALATGIPAELILPLSGDDFCRDLELGLWERKRAGLLPSPPPSSLSPNEEQNGTGAAKQSGADPIPAWAPPAEIQPPPQTFDAIMAAANVLERGNSLPGDINFIMHGVAIARLDPIAERQIFDIIKQRTRLPIADLQKSLKGYRREMGLTATGEHAKPANPWSPKLTLWENGEPKPIMMNVAIVLREAPEWQGVLRMGPGRRRHPCATHGGFPGRSARRQRK